METKVYYGFQGRPYLSCSDQIILTSPDGSKEEKPWAWFQQKSHEEREKVKAWRRLSVESLLGA